MDPAHVSLLDVRIFNASFEKYNVESEIKIGLRVEELYKLLKGFNKKESVRLYNKEEMLCIETKTSKTKLRMIEASNTNTPLPKIPLNAKVSITLDAFKKALNQIGTVSNYVKIETTQTTIILSGKGDNGESEIIFERGMEEIPELSVKENSEATYSLEYLQPFLKRLTTSSIITLEYSTAKPIRLEYNHDNISRIYYYIAPRVES